MLPLKHWSVGQDVESGALVAGSPAKKVCKASDLRMKNAPNIRAYPGINGSTVVILLKLWNSGYKVLMKLNSKIESCPFPDCKIIQLPKIHDPRGNLTFIESNRHIPFDIERVYYLYDVPGGAERGGHAHKKLQQFIIAMSGSFDIIIDDGFNKRRIHLNRSYYGLYLCPMIWREIDNFWLFGILRGCVFNKNKHLKCIFHLLSMFLTSKKSTSMNPIIKNINKIKWLSFLILFWDLNYEVPTNRTICL